jgi:hypothetical protein
VCTICYQRAMYIFRSRVYHLLPACHVYIEVSCVPSATSVPCIYLGLVCTICYQRAMYIFRSRVYHLLPACHVYIEVSCVPYATTVPYILMPGVYHLLHLCHIHWCLVCTFRYTSATWATISEYFQASPFLALRCSTPLYRQYQATYRHKEPPGSNGNHSDLQSGRSSFDVVTDSRASWAALCSCTCMFG